MDTVLTGISLIQEKRVELSHIGGRLSFIDTPTFYDQGSNVEGKVREVIEYTATKAMCFLSNTYVLLPTG